MSTVLRREIPAVCEIKDDGSLESCYIPITSVASPDSSRQENYQRPLNINRRNRDNSSDILTGLGIGGGIVGAVGGLALLFFALFKSK